MRKKLVLLMGVMMLAGSFSGCGEQASSGESGSAPGEENSVEWQQESEDKEEEEEGKVDPPEDLSCVYREDCFGYSINIQPYYHTAMGYGYVSYEGDMSRSEVTYITQYSGEVGDDEQKERIDMSQYEDSTDIFDLLIGNIDHELFGGLSLRMEGYDVEALKTEEINGVEMTKFEGEIYTVRKIGDTEYRNTYPIVAYGIKSSKTPILVSCIDRTKDGSSHATWVDKIDVMISTFKDAE